MQRSSILGMLVLSAVLGAVAVPTLVLPPTDATAATRVRAARNTTGEPQLLTPRSAEDVDAFTAVPALKPIYFALGRAEVRGVDRVVLDTNARWLTAHPEYSILVAGHADPRGTAAYNLTLAERRAMAVRDQLVARGVRAERIALATYGEAVPACRAQTERCWAQERAAVVLVRAITPQTP